MKSKNKMFRLSANYDRYDFEGNLEEVQQNLAGFRQMRTGATGLLEKGAAIEARQQPLVADKKSVDLTQGGSPPPPFTYKSWERFTWPIDQIILHYYRKVITKADYHNRRSGPGLQAGQIADLINRRFGTQLTKNAIIGRWNRKLKYVRGPYRRGHADSADPQATPAKAAHTPSLPKLRFLGER